MSVEARRQMIDREHPFISLSRQTELLGMSRSGFYYQPRLNPYEELLMRLIDEIYMEFPCYGSRKIKKQLAHQDHPVCRERVQRLMRIMGIEAIYPKPRTSVPHPDHKVYAYLLRGVDVNRVNQVWSCDITYIRMKQGWLYLMAIMDWYSRFVLSWQLSITMETNFCLTALDRALAVTKPDIFNSDQGSQFTSRAFTGLLSDHDIQISMDGRGRCFDNIFIERLWRSVKYEEVYLHDYASVKEAIQSINAYFVQYNYKRIHQSLGYLTPASVYGGKPIEY